MINRKNNSHLLKLMIPALFLVASCSIQELDYESNLNHTNHGAIDTKAVSSSDCYYHESTGFVLTPNAQYQNHVTTDSSNATHRVVRFFPKETKQLFDIERLEESGCTVSYIPFGYSIVREATSLDAKALQRMDTYKYVKLSESEPIEVDRDFTFEERAECTIQSENKDVFYDVYALCPVDCPLPAGIEYEECENLIIEDRSPILLNWYFLALETYDSFLDSIIPLHNIKVYLSYDGVHTSRFTNEEGIVLLNTDFYNQTIGNSLQTEVYTILSTPDWIIARDTSSTPIHHYHGTIRDIWQNAGVLHVFGADTLHMEMTSYSTEYEIHRAADYYFNSDHEYSDYMVSGESGLTIHAMDGVSPNNYLGLTNPSQSWIKIYNIGASVNDVISAFLHELGHGHHYHKCPTLYYQSDTIVRESYASFLGWCLCESYYLEKGFIKPYNTYQISYQAWQNWTPATSGSYHYYSPFFVDLVDDYNQWSAIYPLRVKDYISGVPISVVEGMIQECNTLSQCRSYLEEYVGTYYTQNDLNLMYSYYE